MLRKPRKGDYLNPEVNTSLGKERDKKNPKQCPARSFLRWCETLGPPGAGM